MNPKTLFDTAREQGCFPLRIGLPGTLPLPEIYPGFKVEGLGFKGLGFKGLGFKGLGFKGLGFRVPMPEIYSW